MSLFSSLYFHFLFLIFFSSFTFNLHSTAFTFSHFYLLFATLLISIFSFSFILSFCIFGSTFLLSFPSYSIRSFPILLFPPSNYLILLLFFSINSFPLLFLIFLFLLSLVPLIHHSLSIFISPFRRFPLVSFLFLSLIPHSSFLPPSSSSYGLVAQ